MPLLPPVEPARTQQLEVVVAELIVRHEVGSQQHRRVHPEPVVVAPSGSRVQQAVGAPPLHDGLAVLGDGVWVDVSAVQHQQRGLAQTDQALHHLVDLLEVDLTIMTITTRQLVISHSK